MMVRIVSGFSSRPTFVEELSLQEDLSVSDGDDIGWDVSRDVTSLGLNDREGSQGTTAHRIGHLGCSLKLGKAF